METTGFEHLFGETISELIKAATLSEREFFSLWFRQRGQPIFFLFRKNLSQTNIQFTELLCLARTHIHIRSAKDTSPNIQFVTLEAFLRTLTPLFTHLKSLPRSTTELPS